MAKIGGQCFQEESTKVAVFAQTRKQRQTKKAQKIKTHLPMSAKSSNFAA
jgi:hypothetical protein